ncbi:MAG: murein L,D-transpeptidase catalytic domain family protein [Bacteroidales bacterium]|nr:murein L,D-transpeptidase catalytic domain family protein [Bacteroidales bacterium]
MGQFSFRKIIRLLLFTGTLLLMSNTYEISIPETLQHAENPSAYFNFSNIDLSLNPQLISSLGTHIGAYEPLARNKILTIIDFSLPSTSKRLWTINFETREVLFNTYVAHGKNTGDNIAENFSNTPQSHQSSLGFYLTANSYIGKHGKSLRLIGLERGLNDNAIARAIVIHGADYVSESFINAHGRLGRSHGCPAIPLELTNDFIETVKDGTLLFVYHPSYQGSN